MQTHEMLNNSPMVVSPLVTPSITPSTPAEVLGPTEINYLTQNEQAFVLSQHQKELASKTPLQAEEYLAAEDALNKFNFETSIALEKKMMQGRNLAGYVSDAIMRMRNSPGKLRKAILAAIGAYNTLEYGLNHAMLREGYKTSPYTCGSIECKERGTKIKKALMNIAVLPANVLGAYGFVDTAMSALNHVGQTRNFLRGKTAVKDYNENNGLPGTKNAYAEVRRGFVPLVGTGGTKKKVRVNRRKRLSRR